MQQTTQLKSQLAAITLAAKSEPTANWEETLLTNPDIKSRGQ